MSKYLQIALLKAHKLYTTAMLAYFWLFNSNLCSFTQAILVPLPICIIHWPTLRKLACRNTQLTYILCWAWTITNWLNDIFPEVKAYLEIGSIILGDKGTVTLAENCDFLLNVFYFVLCFFQINNFNGHNFLSPTVDAFKNFTKRAFPYSVQLGKILLWISSEILKIEGWGRESKL